ncbi:MAG: exodeoxyribonuclease VII small subunit [Rikenellaceae bacterium]
MAKKQISYIAAQEEIESILERLNNQQLDIDTLSSEVARVLELIKICKTRLHKAESEVKELFSSLEQEENREIE